MAQMKKSKSWSLYVVNKNRSQQEQKMQDLHKRWQHIRKLELAEPRISEVKHQFAFIRKALNDQMDSKQLENAKNDSIH